MNFESLFPFFDLSIVVSTCVFPYSRRFFSRFFSWFFFYCVSFSRSNSYKLDFFGFCRYFLSRGFCFSIFYVARVTVDTVWKWRMGDNKKKEKNTQSVWDCFDSGSLACVRCVCEGVAWVAVLRVVCLDWLTVVIGIKEGLTKPKEKPKESPKDKPKETPPSSNCDVF